jgi:hypothetical protein
VEVGQVSALHTASASLQIVQCNSTDLRVMALDKKGY